LNGENTRVAQISGVGTLPEWRRKGLNRQLTDIGLRDCLFEIPDLDCLVFCERENDILSIYDIGGRE